MPLDIIRTVEVNDLLIQQKEYYRRAGQPGALADIAQEQLTETQEKIEKLLKGLPKDKWAFQLPDEVIRQKLRE